eukprot:TRINITY_DN4234_c0_g1_i1.p1 TRINITY_DN4234_c0_g1~~TRINITY_DN4234_c0_g1_i1.p1  ORF type:complete len:281 (-),score=41.56 TRINITY_DN4234_c0_g1_i1:28-870(-)
MLVSSFYQSAGACRSVVRSFGVTQSCAFFARRKCLFYSSQVEVIAEDHDYMFVNKPSGLATAGTPSGITFHEMVKEHAAQSNPHHVPGLLHRLDKVCSGIMVYGKNIEAERYFQQLLQAHHHSKLKKVYLALVRGVPEMERGNVSGGIQRTDGKRRRFSICRKGGKKVDTLYNVVETVQLPSPLDTCSLLSLEPITGRKHQVRASCSALSCPIIGDSAYGGKEDVNGLTLLHSSFISFRSRYGDRNYEISLPPVHWRGLHSDIPIGDDYLHALKKSNGRR